jgi:hypothetical protein
MEWPLMIPLLSAIVTITTVGSIVIAAWISQRRIVEEATKNVQAKVEDTEKALTDELVQQ